MKLVILGAGFGGLRLARELNGDPNIEVTLIDRCNYHQFQPLFYQVATAGLDASNISFPLRKVFQSSKNVKIRMAEILSVNFDEHRVVTNIGDFEYDELVIAMGGTTNYFGNKLLEDNALPMKSTVEALQLRHRILGNFETALVTDSQLEKERLLNFIVVGGGPTGVELSGAIADMKNFVLPKDYPELDFSRMKVHLMEGGPALLGPMSEKSRNEAKIYLENLGVQVHLNTIIDSYDGKTAITKSGERFESYMLIWAAGIKGNLPEGLNPELVARGNRILVDRRCKVPGTQNVYAIGDIAFMDSDPAYPKGHPQVAPVATQMADLVVNNLKRKQMKSGEAQFRDFSYHDKGSMATVGRNLAVVDIPKPKMHLKGVLAWFIWMSLHLMLILGVKNRLFVFMNWVYSYFARDQNLRLIFKEYYKELDIEKNMKQPETVYAGR